VALLILDVNGRYIHRHSLLDEIKQTLSKITSTIISSDDFSSSESYKSVILILRITSPEKSTLCLAQTVTTLLENTGLAGKHSVPFRRGIVALDLPRLVESKIVSARGIEYSKGKTRERREAQIVIGREEPGIEYHQRVRAW